MNKFLIKIDRLSAWVLLIGFVFFFITGYGMVKGFVNVSWAANLHDKILPPIILIAFLIHSSYAVSLALKRWGAWNTLGKTIYTLFFVGFLSFFIFINYLYKIPKTTASLNQNSSVSQQKNKEDAKISEDTSSNSNSSSQKTFTPDELAKYDGKNGQPAYVAVDGIVYDVSSIFINGSHYSYSAGRDLTQEFHLYHNSSVLSGLPIVGTLVK